MKIITRCANIELYLKMVSLLPKNIKCEPRTNYHGYIGATDFLYEIINKESGILIILDEDCFIYNFKSVIELCVKKFALCCELID